MPAKPMVTLFYRKPRRSGNYSIEAAFDQIMASFSSRGDFQFRKLVSSHMSNGVLPRIKAVLEARREASQINHVTGDVNYLALGLPRDRTVVTIHDCGMIDRVQNPIRRQILKWLWLDLPLRRATLITADSFATRDDIVRLTGIESNKIVVVPVCISSKFSPAPGTFHTACPEVLHIGTAYNKNLERHIEALSGINCSLKIIGQVSAEQQRLLDAHDIKFSIHDSLTETQVIQAYRDCDLVLFASTLEGFGMPILEAQTVGRPVITSNTSSMPEIAGSGACLVDPFDIESIRSGIVRVIEDDDYRHTLVDAGFENVTRFRPETIAPQFESIYSRLQESHQPAAQAAPGESSRPQTS